MICTESRSIPNGAAFPLFVARVIFKINHMTRFLLFFTK